jgi:asparagine synthase (glutamine-hydrolysing)
MKDDLYSSAFKQAMAGNDSVALTEAAYAGSDAATLLEKQLYADATMYLPYDLLVKVDIASMANSLEARSPFLDHKVMEFAARLPADLKLRGSQGKFLLKKAFEPMLPPEILYRKKMGFGVPINRWLRTDLKQPAYDILLDSRTIGRGYFKREAVRRMFDEHIALQADHSYRLWALLWLELWHRMFVDKSDVLGL